MTSLEEQNTIRWRDRVLIARHEILCAAIIIADLLDGHHAAERDWDRLTLILQRLRALTEAP